MSATRLFIGILAILGTCMVADGWMSIGKPHNPVDWFWCIVAHVGALYLWGLVFFV